MAWYGMMATWYGIVWYGIRGRIQLKAVERSRKTRPPPPCMWGYRGTEVQCTRSRRYQFTAYEVCPRGAYTHMLQD